MDTRSSVGLPQFVSFVLALENLSCVGGKNDVEIEEGESGCGEGSYKAGSLRFDFWGEWSREKENNSRRLKCVHSRREARGSANTIS
mmetsp:Transcript_9186/g.27641  ORF Transcript_9186/g.27641 Transcript_9186/m.27641 type:complete len:87 (+) Transcript_9186:528-788(+)